MTSKRKLPQGQMYQSWEAHMFESISQSCLVCYMYYTKIMQMHITFVYSDLLLHDHSMCRVYVGTPVLVLTILILCPLWIYYLNNNNNNLQFLKHATSNPLGSQCAAV